MSVRVGATAPYRQYLCTACGFVYDEARGDPDGGLAAGTRYEDIPDDWYCPLCGVGKADFSLYVAPAIASLQARQQPTDAGAPRARRTRAGVVIVGGGRAGWQVAEGLRQRDATVPITLVSACEADVYDKPMLSVALARHVASGRLVKERGADAARRLQVRLLARTHAVRIDRERCRVRTTRGTLPYEQLVLAHGAQAVLPEGLPAALCWRINHLETYQRLRARLDGAGREVLVVGAGLIGSELANDLALGGHRVTLLDLEHQPLARWCGQGAGTRLLEAWKPLPIRFVGGVRIGFVRQQGRRVQVRTRCGQTFEADHIVVSAGLQTPGRLARGAGLAWNNGIAVDTDTLRTSDPRIHALGDCIAVQGQASRFIEPIGRQVHTVVADLCGDAPVPYAVRPSVVRVKTTSLPMTLQEPRAGGA